MLLFLTACNSRDIKAVVDEDDVTPEVPHELKPVTKDDLRETFEVDKY